MLGFLWNDCNSQFDPCGNLALSNDKLIACLPAGNRAGAATVPSLVLGVSVLGADEAHFHTKRGDNPFSPAPRAPSSTTGWCSRCQAVAEQIILPPTEHCCKGRSSPPGSRRHPHQWRAALTTEWYSRPDVLSSICFAQPCLPNLFSRPTVSELSTRPAAAARWNTFGQDTMPT